MYQGLLLTKGQGQCLFSETWLENPGKFMGHYVEYQVFLALNWALLWTSLVAQRLKHLPAMWENRVWSLGQEDPLEKETATHSSILAWEIPRTEEPGDLQSTGRKESDTAEWFHLPFLLVSPKKKKKKKLKNKMQ